METVTLTTPITDYQVAKLVLDLQHAAIEILLQVPGSDSTVYFLYSGGEAITLMRALNKMDLSVKSLHRRILEKLIADGKLVGVVSGAPD